ncbi:hypothetical protein [Streptomyces jumonjinensis]|uniref:Uncharacterized protein n=1 Tax=Streptomyces jumonjinensis TaxID=1945 RepID=A0A646KT00_STRJU|nr:hypothetical protein [Streptomyces jumonjinensis]MQT05452.1 hypothetical protein [Streptomyces jumonjinensis]
MNSNNSVGVEVETTAQWLEGRAAHGAASLLRRVARQRDDALRQLSASGDVRERSASPATADLDTAAEAAMLRTDLARLQALAERAGWVADSGPKRLWRWRDGWWELGHRKKDQRDGYPDTGWYLWGPTGSYDGEWVATHKADAMVDADRLITQHLTPAEARR